MAAAAADRHLLFGLLALQTGIINQGQLVAAFQAWTLDKMRNLADILVARGDLNAVQRGLLEGLADQHVEKHGDVEKSPAAVPANRSARASLAALGEPEIGATLARVARSKNGPATDAEDDDPERTGTFSVGSPTSDGQRFRILRPHARGGLGAVFVALDGELHREVALKQILEKYADDSDSRQRFVAEAEITGGLEHPGVVPVYGLGTDSFGRPYYAMRFIKGDSLKEAIARFHEDEAKKTDPGHRSLELRKLLRRFTDVCNAIDYAHSRGVIHRDLKPANIIVGKYGETLVVDWGLAKVVGRADPSTGEQTLAPSSGGSSETLPGSALGTPAYMSPEQARGELHRLGPRSDVYSLGATLYCLLTGKPPFENDEDIGAVLRAVQEGQFRRPSQHDPALDRALEAICLKAMRHQPEDRYRHAQGPGRRPGSLDGRRAGHGLARAILAPGAAMGAEEPHRSDGRGRGPGGRGGRAYRPCWPCRPGPTRAGRCQCRADPLSGRRPGPVRPGRRRDQDVSHRRQRRLPAQAGAVQGGPRPAAEVGQRLLRQAGCLARQGVGPGFAAGAVAGELRSGRADGQGRQAGGLRWRHTGRSSPPARRWRPKRRPTRRSRPTWGAA